jgi:hypothetical protein
LVAEIQNHERNLCQFAGSLGKAQPASRLYGIRYNWIILQGKVRGIKTDSYGLFQPDAV